VHLAHIYARLGLGAPAEECLALLLRTCVQNNLLTTHDDWRGQGLTMGSVRERGTLQLDAVYGATSAIQECLVQSTSESLVLCPALFPSWIRASVRGLGTRCGLVVDLDWDLSSGHAQAVLHAERPTRVSVSWGRLRHDTVVELAAGDCYKINNKEIR
jgi:alpha-L-fucosidase 2